MTPKERNDKFYSIHNRKEYYHNQYLRRSYYIAEYRKRNGYIKPPKELLRKRYADQVNKISDYYCKKLLKSVGFDQEEITTELIELKRQQIILSRLLQ